MISIPMTKTALRYRAIFLDIDRAAIDMTSAATAPVMAFVTRLRENGFCVSEELLHALNAVTPDTLAQLTQAINEVMGVELNWAPLVKGWKAPTGESFLDHIVTFFANIPGVNLKVNATTLPCGHKIPDGTFPLERYNGCPFCGMPFVTADFVYKGQASKLKELRLFTRRELEEVFRSLLTSVTPLDATQRMSLADLLPRLPLPAGVDIPMKETAMLVVRTLTDYDRDDEAAALLRTPADILRYLWYEKTGRVQIIEPRTLIAHAHTVYRHIYALLDRSRDAARAMKLCLRLRYTRKECRRVAGWLNALTGTPRQIAEEMNPKRGMWVRMIHALRLGEYSRRPGFGHLAAILDVFYRRDYTTWQGRVDSARQANDAAATFALLKQRPGLFARCLFSTMLRFGSADTIAAFTEVSDKVAPRLLMSLCNAAEIYFDTVGVRLAHPITGIPVEIEHNKLLRLYDRKDREAMTEAIKGVYAYAMENRFAAAKTDARTIYIDPVLYDIPVSVGDRTVTVQDTSCALPGMRFPVEGDAVRLFLQWGKGLPAQWLDMDLSCRIVLPDGTFTDCAYYNLVTPGARHSGDIRAIPDMVGTAEYIELSIPDLIQAGARYVIFSCNAYSAGTLSPNLVVGWMNSAYPMQVSEENGVGYDPSCVQQMVRISEGDLSKGLVFGVLDVARREIVWLEMPNTAQTQACVNPQAVEAMLKRLKAKMTIGRLLDLKARAQNLTRTDSAADADEAYTAAWALNPAAVTALLVPA